MSAYTDFFLNSKSSVVQLELLEISHPNFSKTYRVVRNAVNGVTVTHETAAVFDYEYYPLKIKPQGARDDLDHFIEVSFGDLGEILPLELDNIMKAPGGMQIKPTVKYRVYRSDQLTAPLYGPLLLEVSSLSFDEQGCTFEAKAPALNLTRTGQIYSISRFPPLRGFIT